MPWSLVVADVLGIIKLLPCLCVLALLRPGAFSAILTTWRNNRVSLPPRVPISHRRALSPPLHSAKPLGPGMEDPIPTSNTSFSSLQFSNIFFCQFLIIFFFRVSPQSAANLSTVHSFTRASHFHFAWQVSTSFWHRLSSPAASDSNSYPKRFTQSYWNHWLICPEMNIHWERIWLGSCSLIAD